jgi:hypothetical protein
MTFTTTATAAAKMSNKRLMLFEDTPSFKMSEFHFERQFLQAERVVSQSVSQSVSLLFSRTVFQRYMES